MLPKLASAFLFFTASAFAQGAPESFYLAGFDGSRYVIIDVQPASAADSRVRYIEAYPECDSYTVEEEEYLFEKITVAQLAANADVCGPEQSVLKPVNASTRRPGNEPEEAKLEWMQGIAAQCGTRTVVHHLSARSGLKQASLDRSQIAGLWALSPELIELFSKATGRSLFARDSDWRAQRIRNAQASEFAASEIRSGKYDLVLPEIPGNWRKNGFSKLSDILPPPEEAVGIKEDAGQVENIDQLGLEKNPNPIMYPQIARIAHIEGDVKAQLSVDPSTGKVSHVEFSSGHPILRVGATDAIKKWVFSHPYFGQNPVSITIHYKVRCPLVVETTSTSVVKAKRHHWWQFWRKRK